MTLVEIRAKRRRLKQQVRAVVHELLVQGGSSRKPRQCWRSIQPPNDAHKTEELAF